jgi:hypothetical protein
VTQTRNHLLEPIIIDIEASGFDPMSYPIEVGLALASGKRFSSLVLPLKQWTHWDAEAEKLHKINQQTLLSHGKPIQQVAENLNKLLAGETVYSDGWVVDKPWLDLLFFEAGLKMDFYLSPIELILSEPQMEIWHTVKTEMLEQSDKVRHRACSDAWIIQQTYIKTAQQTRTVKN